MSVCGDWGKTRAQCRCKPRASGDSFSGDRVREGEPRSRALPVRAVRHDRVRYSHPTFSGSREVNPVVSDRLIAVPLVGVRWHTKTKSPFHPHELPLGLSGQLSPL